MVEIKLNDDKSFNVIGTVNFGYVGTYKNSKIKISGDLEDIKLWPHIFKSITDTNNTDEILAVLTEYVNNFIAKIEANHKLINNQFLYNVFSDMINAEIAYWTYPDLTIEDKLPTHTEFVYDSIDLEELDPIKDDVEKALRNAFPSFNFDAFIGMIIPYVVTFDRDTCSFQCDDGLGCDILVGTYDELDKDLNFTDWHNW